MHFRSRRLILFIVSLGLCAEQVATQKAPPPDVLLFKNGEKLTGKFIRSDGASVIFRSESVGTVTVPWSKVEDLQSPQIFAVIEKDKQLRRGEDPEKFPQGKISVKNDQLVVRGTDVPERTVAIRNTSHVIDEQSFQRSIADGANLLQAWKGTFTGGVSVVEATQSSQTYNGAIGLVRALPVESWLERRQRTLLNVKATYGTLTQPNALKLRTEIYHGDLEHDVYFTQRLFSFGQTAFDHNFSQGLSLAQNYGGGIGWTVLKHERSEVDLRNSLIYLRQSFADPSQDQNLVGSIFAQSFMRRFARDTRLTQHLTATPAWNNPSAYSATGDLTLTLPVYRRLLFTVGIVNTFINNPSPGFRKNSFQATTGLTYSLP